MSILSQAGIKDSMNYYPWLVDNEDESFAWIWDTPRELMERNYLLLRGEPCKDWFPEGLVFDLSKDRGAKLTDCIPNTDRLLIVSERLKDILEREAPADPIEFLPVRLRNPRGKMVEAPYFIANLLGTVPCMDEDRSWFTMDTILKTQVQRFKRLTLDEQKIPQEKKVFRLGEKRSLIITREDLAKTILRAGCDGMMFVPLEDYGAEFRG